MDKAQQYKATLEKLEDVPVNGLSQNIFEDIYERKYFKTSFNWEEFKEPIIRWDLKMLEDHGWEIDIFPTFFKRRKDYKGIKYEFEHE